MSKELEYYDELQRLVDKAKELKLWISSNDDAESKMYLLAALEMIYVEMRELIKNNQKDN